MPTKDRLALFGSDAWTVELAAHAANSGIETLLGASNAAEAQGATESLLRKRDTLLWMPQFAARVRCLAWPDFLREAPGARWVVGCADGSGEDLRVPMLALSTRLRGNQTLFVHAPASSAQCLAELVSFGPADPRVFGLRLYPDVPRSGMVGLVPIEGSLPKHRAEALALWDRTLGLRAFWFPDFPGSGGWGLWLAASLRALAIAERLEAPIEAIDAATAALGLSRHGIFTDLDHFGLDRALRLATELHRAWEIPVPETLRKLVERGRVGSRSGQGLFRVEAARDAMPLELSTLAYREPRDPPRLPGFTNDPIAAIREAARPGDAVGEFLRMWIPALVRHAVDNRSATARTAWEADSALVDGFGWRMGPFRLAESLLTGSSLEEAPYYEPGRTRVFGGGWAAIVRPEGCEPLAELPVIDQDEGWTLRESSRGPVLCLAAEGGVLRLRDIHSLERFLADGSERSILLAAPAGWPVWLDPEGLLEVAGTGRLEAVGEFLEAFDRLCLLIERRVRASLVDRPCLGVGLSLALSATVAIVHAPCPLGFPETSIGLNPLGLGPVRLLSSSLGRGPGVVAEFAGSLFRGEIAWNAFLAQSVGLLRSVDRIALHRDRLLEAIPDELSQVGTDESWPSTGAEAGLLRALDGLRKTRGADALQLKAAQRIKGAWSLALDWRQALELQRRAFVEGLASAACQARLRSRPLAGGPAQPLRRWFVSSHGA
ncbi:MAG: 3-hydroxyacyl-CoA dehydrogenase family protein [Fimbriimonadales bacterium]|nr:3-hydroxyacyl-CoA dehydrogenase family protein [Fimbriimonadales bacterium]